MKFPDFNRKSKSCEVELKEDLGWYKLESNSMFESTVEGKLSVSSSFSETEKKGN